MRYFRGKSAEATLSTQDYRSEKQLCSLKYNIIIEHA